jgi:hypothetical protein
MTHRLIVEIPVALKRSANPAKSFGRSVTPPSRSLVVGSKDPSRMSKLMRRLQSQRARGSEERVGRSCSSDRACLGISRHQFLSHARSLAIDLIGCRTETPQHRFGHRKRHLAFTGKHLLGTRLS